MKKIKAEQIKTQCQACSFNMFTVPDISSYKYESFIVIFIYLLTRIPHSLSCVWTHSYAISTPLCVFFCSLCMSMWAEYVLYLINPDIVPNRQSNPVVIWKEVHIYY